MRDTIDMARETGVAVWHRDLKKWQVDQNLKDFEALVRADEREAFAKIQFESLLQAIRIEREACAKVCDELSPPCGYNLTETSFWDVTSLECAAAIRARGNT